MARLKFTEQAVNIARIFADVAEAPATANTSAVRPGAKRRSPRPGEAFVRFQCGQKVQSKFPSTTAVFRRVTFTFRGSRRSLSLCDRLRIRSAVTASSRGQLHDRKMTIGDNALMPPRISVCFRQYNRFNFFEIVDESHFWRIAAVHLSWPTMADDTALRSDRIIQ